MAGSYEPTVKRAICWLASGCDETAINVSESLIDVISKCPSQDLGAIELSDFFKFVSLGLSRINADEWAGGGLVDLVDVADLDSGTVDKEDLDISHGEKSVGGGVDQVKPSTQPTLKDGRLA